MFFKKKKTTDSDTKKPEPIVEAQTQATEEPKKGWFKKLSQGLQRSSNKLTESVSSVFTKKRLDDETLEALEEALIMSDMGVKTANEITMALAKDKFDKDITPEEVNEFLASSITTILEPVAIPLTISAENQPTVILVAGVNGNGKTTTIGKLAKSFQDQGKKVMLAACDTFRAAAVEQLQVWGERVGCEVVMGPMESDPASVAFQAVEKAKTNGTDVLLIDTAGRLHNKKNLMEQLEKIVRVIKKIDDTAPHHSVMVLDATTGQNAHNQLTAFKEVVNLTGLIVTKLDGTAKGGVVVALANQYGLPIHAIGVGEAIDDLQPFTAADFAAGLVGIN